MAPRKDAAGQVPSASQTQQDASSEGIEDFELPRVLVIQLARSALPPDVKLDDDMITALVKGSTVFINYLTAAAQEIAGTRAHKTISGADVLKALEGLQFGELLTAVQGELEVFRQSNRSKNKVVSDAKGKNSDSPVGTRPPPASQGSAISAVSTILHSEAPYVGEIAPNGSLVVDVEMRDAGEQGIDNHNVRVQLPMA